MRARSSGQPPSASEDDEDGGVRFEWKEREKDDNDVVNEHVWGRA